MYEYNDILLTCVDCSQEFVFSAGEQQFFADKGLKNQPKRCKECKEKKNERILATSQLYQRERVEEAVRCALCAIETTVPFKPTQGRPVYCRDCFLKMRGSSTRYPSGVV